MVDRRRVASEGGVPAAAPRSSDSRRVDIAEVARPHGIRGELRLKVYSGDGRLLLRRPPMRLRMPDGAEREVTLATARAADKAVLVKLAGVEDRNAAELLRGAVLSIERDALPPPEEGEFYVCDIEGARVELVSGEAVGTVRSVTTYPTCDVLVIRRSNGEVLEVPLVEAFVASVDVEAGLVRLHTLDGLS